MNLDFETLEKIEKSFELIERRFGDNVNMKRAVLAEYGVDLDLFPTVFEPSPNSVGQQVAKQQQENENRAVELSNKMIYGDKWFVLQNRLVNAISNLDLNERRLIMFLSPMVRKDVDENPTKQRRVFTVKATEFAEMYGIQSNNVYKALADTADTILGKAFWYWNFKDDKLFGEKTYKTGLNWFARCNYLEKQGELSIILNEDVIEMLTVFDKANPFTKFEIDILVKLGSYGIILYELIVSCLFQKHQTKTYTINYLREKFNCTETYPLLAEFKRNVIDRAIKEIHTYTPIRISYTQNKRGRIVTELVFNFEDISKTDDKKLVNKNGDNERDKDTIDMLAPIKMTDKQRQAFANKLAHEPELEKYAVGDLNHYGRLAKWIEQDILNDDRANFYRPILQRLGFVEH